MDHGGAGGIVGSLVADQPTVQIAIQRIEFDRDRHFAPPQKFRPIAVDARAAREEFNPHPLAANVIDELPKLGIGNRLAVDEQTAPGPKFPGLAEQRANFLQGQGGLSGLRRRLAGRASALPRQGQVDFDGQQPLALDASVNLLAGKPEAVDSN
jgi:hypothetical protein